VSNKREIVLQSTCKMYFTGCLDIRLLHLFFVRRPGPFVNLCQLKYGDEIIIRAYGQNYVFAVQTNTVVEPNDASAMKHEEKSWLTLVTCKDYDEKAGAYKKRLLIRAVLVRVMWQ
jgi:LPXTG-site transpeptidase (sortase) family protein